MSRATAEITEHPFSGDVLDLDAAGTALGPSALAISRNCFARDDGTLTKRPGLGSHHDAFDATGSALNGLGLTTMEVLGLFQFDRLTDAMGTASLFLAKVGDYLIGSRFGRAYDLKIAKNLGVFSVPDFCEVYNEVERQRYLILCTNDRGFQPSYWRGNLTPADAYGVADWDYLRPLSGAGYQEFSTVHKGWLYLAGGDPFQVIAVPTASFQDFSAAVAFVAAPEYGRVTGFVKTYYGELLLGQEFALSRVLYDSNGVPVDAVPVITGVGLANNRSAVAVGNDRYFLATDGQVYSLQTTQQFGDFRANSISGNVYRDFDRGPLAARPFCWAQNDREHQAAWFGISRFSGQRVDTCWGFDYGRKRTYRLVNRSLHGPSCAAAWRLPHFNGIEKVAFGFYEVDDAEAAEKGRIFFFNDRHKEDHYIVSRVESADATTPNNLKPYVRFPDPVYGGGAAGWPHQNLVSVSGTYSGTATTWTTILVQVTSISVGTGVIGTGTIAASWRDVKGSSSGTLALGSAYTVGTDLTLTGTGIKLRFSATQTLPVHVSDELWILVDRGYKIVETYRSGLYDDIEIKTDLKKVGDSRTYRNFVAYAQTPIMYAGSPDKATELDAITFITRVIGSRGDNVDANEGTVAPQSIFRHALDVLFKCDEDVVWRQVALLDGNDAKQWHLDQSKGELSGKFVYRTDRQLILGATLAESGRFVGEGAVNVRRVKIGRRCKTWEIAVGQFTAAANPWNLSGITDPFNAFTGDFGLVGMIFHLQPLPDDVPSIMGEASMTKTWEVGA